MQRRDPWTQALRMHTASIARSLEDAAAPGLQDLSSTKWKWSTAAHRQETERFLSVYSLKNDIHTGDMDTQDHAWHTLL